MNELFEAFLNRPISPHTREKYFYRLRPFIALHGQKQPAEITSGDITAYIASKTAYAEASKAILRQCLHAFFGYCIKRGQCELNPVKGTPTYRATPRRIVLPNETEVETAVNEAVAMCQSQNPVTVRDGLIFTLAVVSGNRRGELRQLPLDDLLTALTAPETLKNGHNIYRVYTDGKTGEAICRFTEFHKPLVDLYLSIRPDTRCNAVFVNCDPRHDGHGKQISLVTFNRVRPKVCRRAKVSIITYQELRRRIATKIARANGVDTAAHALNHSPHSGDRVIRAHYYNPDQFAVDEEIAAAFSFEE